MDNNRQIIQSYILTTAKYEFSTYEKRILTSLITKLQPLLEGKKLKGQVELCKAEKDLWGDYHFELPLSFFMTQEDTNFERYKEAITALNEKKMEYEDEEVWRIIRIIDTPQFFKRKRVVKFTLADQLVTAFLNYSRGFSKYSLSVSLGLKSIYAVRLYELMANQRQPLTFRISKLKEMFDVTDKYNTNFNFIQRVIVQAKKELDEVANWSFNFEPIKKGKRFESIKLIPIHYPEREPQEIDRAEAVRRLGASWFVSDTQIRNTLKKQCGFTDREIKNNAGTIQAFCKLFQDKSLQKFTEIWERAKQKNNPKAYFIGAIKLELEENLPI